MTMYFLSGFTTETANGAARAFGLGSAIEKIRQLACAALLVGAALTATAAIDPHPELKSRAQAWGEYDGSFLVDTTSRADMQDFWWTVFARPFPAVQWSGSLSPAVAGEVAEQFRQREYAQLNAYRALNYSPAMSEDATKRSLVQEGALVFALNPAKPWTHTIDSTWSGYTALRAQAAASSLVGGYYASENTATTYPLAGAVDGFILDDGAENAAGVGHRTFLLHDANTTGAVGLAYSPVWGAYSAVWNCPMQYNLNGSAENFVAWPAPGQFPLGFMRYQPIGSKLRWSFALATDNTGNWWQNANVTAKINGKAVAVQNLVRFGGGPLTWEFASSDLDPATAADGTQVEIAVTNVFDVPYQSGSTRSYSYTVTLFDENKIVPGGYSAKTPLVNISTRSTIGSGDSVMIAGFVVSGTLPVRVALRTQGPGLARFGIQNTAKKTRLQLFDQATGQKLGENAGWKTHQDWRLLQSLGVSPTDDNEAGMVATLWPGAYTAIVSDDTGANGVGIVEAFNIDNLTPSRLANLSTRGNVGTGEQQMIAGIVIKDQPRTVVIRTQGPGLAQFGVGNCVQDTTLTVVAQSDGHTVAQNDDWRTDARNSRLSTDLAVFAPSDNREAALLLTLPPGAYTALVSAKGAPGVGIVEIFEVSP